MQNSLAPEEICLLFPFCMKFSDALLEASGVFLVWSAGELCPDTAPPCSTDAESAVEGIARHRFPAVRLSSRLLAIRTSQGSQPAWIARYSDTLAPALAFTLLAVVVL